MEKTKQDIMRALKRNKKGITRQALAVYTGRSDRVNRQAISLLRAEGVMIGTTINGGYSLNNKRDFERTMNFLRAKTRNEEKMLRRMKRTLEEENQITIS